MGLRGKQLRVLVGGLLAISVLPVASATLGATPTAPTGGTSLASDAFTRSVTSGWGSADVGGAYSLGGGFGAFDVDGTRGTLTLHKAGANRFATLPVAARDVDVLFRVSFSQLPVGAPAYAYGLTRRGGSDEYRSKLVVRPDGSVAVGAGIVINGTEAPIGGAPRTVAGINYTPAAWLWLRTVVMGSSPTTIRANVWLEGTPEPVGWQLSATDSSTAVQDPGAAGVRGYLGDRLTNTPMVIAFDELSVSTATDAAPTPTPTPMPTPTPTFPPTPASTSVVAADAFTRTSSAEWANADFGSLYSYVGRLADFGVSDGSGVMTLPTAGTARSAFLFSTFAANLEMAFSTWLDRPATGDGVWIYGTARRATNGSAYRPKIRIASDGAVFAVVSRVTPAGEAPLGTPVLVPGLIAAPNEPIRIRAVVTGANPTTIAIRAWAASSAEPAAWQFSATDSTPALQQAGSVGLIAYTTPNVTNAPIAVRFDDLSVTTTDPPTLTGPVLVGAGDIASCSSPDDEATARLLGLLGGTVFTAGDNVDAATQDFANCFEPSWGPFKPNMNPAPGNHEYNGSPQPYYDYFGPAAGEPDKGYYAVNVGTWRVYVLNSNCGVVSCAAGAAQEQWLRADLAASPNTCQVAIWHHPRFSSGSPRGSTPAVQPLWQALYDAGVELAVTGHDHDYERFAPMDGAGALDQARGVRQFVVGTGGANLRPLGTTLPNSEVIQNGSYGVLKLVLGTGGYEWEFIPIAGRSFTDRGSGTCH